MKKVLLALALFLGGIQSALSAGYDTNTYYNLRFGFKVSYPATTDKNWQKGVAFELGEESHNGDGNGMYNPLDGARIIAYGHWSGMSDAQEDDKPEDLTESGMRIGCTLNDIWSENVTYKHQSSSASSDIATVSGISEGNIFYKKAIYVKDDINEPGTRCLLLDIVYPVSEKEKYDEVVKGVSLSFSPIITVSEMETRD